MSISYGKRHGSGYEWNKIFWHSKSNPDTIELRVGDCIQYSVNDDDYTNEIVKITGFKGDMDVSSIIYAPYSDKKKEFITYPPKELRLLDNLKIKIVDCPGVGSAAAAPTTNMSAAAPTANMSGGRRKHRRSRKQRRTKRRKSHKKH